MKRADKLFENFAFSDAIDLYGQLIEGPEADLANLKLAECYRLTNRLPEAEKYYAKSIDMKGIERDYLLHYAMALQSNGKCSDAVSWYRRYSYLNPQDPRPDLLAASCEDVSLLLQQEGKYELLPLNTNGPKDEFAPCIYKDGLVFAATAANDKKGTYHWTGDNYYSLFYSQGGKNKFEEAVPFPAKFDREFNLGPASFTGTGEIVFFSRNAGRGKKNLSSSGKSNLQIYTAELDEDGAWSKETILDFCTTEHNYTHPSTTASGESLYFASDRAGTMGGMDIWVTHYTTDSGWSKPQNLGPEINSKGDEMFPFVHDDGTLYFSSNGLGGFGGLDLYEARFVSGRFAKPENMRSPINSNRDDFGLVFDSERNQGYFSSNRDNGKGGDDIYSLTRFPHFIEGILLEAGTRGPLSDGRIILTQNGEQIDQRRTDALGRFVVRVRPYESYTLSAYREGYDPIEITLTSAPDEEQRVELELQRMEDAQNALSLDLKVIHKETKLPLDGAQIYLRDELTGIVKNITTDANGNASIVVDKTVNYSIAADKEQYFNLSEQLTSRTMAGQTKITRVLELAPYEVGQVVQLNNIIYSPASADLNVDARIELDKLVVLLQTNPSMKVEIGSHTDSDGSDMTNNRLSQRRAEGVVSYLTKAGIEISRMTAVGYGESRLLNHCEDGVQCPPELHRENRRTEFKILEY